MGGFMGIVVAFVSVAECEGTTCEEKLGTILVFLPVAVVLGASLGGWAGYLLARRVQRS